MWTDFWTFLTLLPLLNKSYVVIWTFGNPHLTPAMSTWFMNTPKQGQFDKALHKNKPLCYLDPEGGSIIYMTMLLYIITCKEIHRCLCLLYFLHSSTNLYSLTYLVFVNQKNLNNKGRTTVIPHKTIENHWKRKKFWQF